jgi:hypothetical protein
MMKRLCLMLAVVLLSARPSSAQSGARIGGVVRDSAAQPVSNADVLVIPSERRVRTDSAGRFEVTGLDAGKYTVRARRFGYLPSEWSVDLSHGGRADVQLVLGAKLAQLEPVVVSADRTCSPTKFDGFMCRRGSTKGVFLDYTDIDDRNVYYTGDLFGGMDGFGVSVQPTRNGPVRVPIGRRCINTLINGQPAGSMSVPQDPYNIMAIEIYKLPADVPKEFKRHTWGKESCSVNAYWTVDFSTPLPHVRLPR